MGIFGKFVDIVKANVNDMIDKAEDPAKMVKLMIIEMEEAVTKATSAVAQAMANEKNMERNALKAKEEATNWGNKAAQALKAGREDLAKEALAKKVTYDQQAQQYEQMRATANQTTTQLKNNLDQIRAKLEEARLKESTLVARSESAKAQKTFAEQMSKVNSNSAFAKFDKMEEKIIKQEAEADAFTELSGTNTNDEFAKLESNTKVDDELAKLKQQLNM